MENTIQFIVNIAVALFAVCTYISLLCSVYPYFTMRLVWRGELGIRGRRRVVFPNGRGVVYEPSLDAKKYIDRYAVYEQNGGKYLVCKINTHIEYLRYDAVSFDRKGKILDIVSVSENIRENGETNSVRLPERTAYACVLPRMADGVAVKGRRVLAYSYVGMGVFAAVNILTTAVMSVVLCDSLSFVFSYMMKWFTAPETSSVLGLGIGLGVLSTALSLAFYYLHNIRVINK